MKINKKIIIPLIIFISILFSLCNDTGNKENTFVEGETRIRYLIHIDKDENATYTNDSYIIIPTLVQDSIEIEINTESFVIPVLLNNDTHEYELRNNTKYHVERIETDYGTGLKINPIPIDLVAYINCSPFDICKESIYHSRNLPVFSMAEDSDFDDPTNVVNIYSTANLSYMYLKIGYEGHHPMYFDYLWVNTEITENWGKYSSYLPDMKVL